MKSIKSINIKSFKEDGFQIHNPFSDELLNGLKTDLFNRISMQAYKVGMIEKFTFKKYSDSISPEELESLIINLNKINKRSVDFAYQELRECPAFYSLINQDFKKICSNLLDCPEELLKIHIDGVLMNLPSNEQRLYKFHTEEHYYPYRKNFLNFWMPVVIDKTKSNGAMVIMHKGHNKKYSMNEYSGFSKVEGEKFSEEDFFYQLQVPKNELEGEKTICDLSVGDALFFHSNTPHTSSLNTSNNVSYAFIARVYDYRKDLTLSDRTGIKSYSAASGGYPDLRPIL
tara:strand:- start:535 stop:1392 length:858 start_codon:yes stop_codon:yes gene_type:complete